MFVPQAGGMQVLGGEGMVRRRLKVEPREESWLRFVLEAEDGLAVMTAEGQGIVSVYAPVDMEAALDQVLADLASELDYELLTE